MTSGSNKRPICIPLFNGICNRITPLISTLRLAKQCGRPIKALWTGRPGRSCIDYSGAGVEFGDLFEPIPMVEFVENQQELDVYYGNGNFVCHNFDYTIRQEDVKIQVDLDDVDGDKSIFIIFLINVIFSSRDTGIDIEKYKLSRSGRFEKDPVFLELGRLCSQYLSPVRPLRVEIDRMRVEHFAFPERVLGFHIRRTDGMFLSGNWIMTDDAIERKMEEWLEISETNRIFLSTDSFSYDRKIRNLFGGKVVTYRPHNVFKFKNDDANVKHSVVDLYSLGMCAGIVGTIGSSFSLVGAILGGEGRPFWYSSEDPESVSQIDLSLLMSQ